MLPKPMPGMPMPMSTPAPTPMSPLMGSMDAPTGTGIEQVSGLMDMTDGGVDDTDIDMDAETDPVEAEKSSVGFVPSSQHCGECAHMAPEGTCTLYGWDVVEDDGCRDGFEALTDSEETIPVEDDEAPIEPTMEEVTETGTEEEEY